MRGPAHAKAQLWTCARGLTEARVLDRNEPGKSGGTEVRDVEGLGAAQV